MQSLPSACNISLQCVGFVGITQLNSWNLTHSRRPHPATQPAPVPFSLAIRGFLLRGFWEVRGFPFCGGKKGLRLPLARGLRLPRSLGRSMRNKGVSDPSPHRKRESQTPFSHRKRENPVPPKIPLAKIPLAQPINLIGVPQMRFKRWGLKRL